MGESCHVGVDQHPRKIFAIAAPSKFLGGIIRGKAQPFAQHAMSFLYMIILLRDTPPGDPTAFTF